MLDSSESTSHPSREWAIIGLASFGHTLCHIAELAFAALIPVVMFEFELTADKAALLAVPGFILFGVGAVPAGIWTDRRGSREAMTIFFVAVIVASLSVYCAKSAWALGASLTLLGASLSIYHPTGLAMLSHGCKNVGRAMGINGVAGSLGVAIGPTLGLYMVSHHSWRTTYVVTAGLSMIGLLGSLFVRCDVPSHNTTSQTATQTGSGGVSASVLALLFAAMMVGGFNYRCVTTALPTYLSGGSESVDEQTTKSAAKPVETTGNPARPSGSGGRVFLVFALGGVGQLLGGYLADRFRPSRVYPVVILVTVVIAGLIARTSVELGTWLAAALLVFMFSQQPLENTMIAVATPARWRSTIFGLKFILAFGVASLGVYVAGLVWRYVGIVHVFDVCALGAVLMALLAICYAIKRAQPPVRRNVVA